MKQDHGFFVVYGFDTFGVLDLDYVVTARGKQSSRADAVTLARLDHTVLDQLLGWIGNGR